ncbi:hypothetical protein RND71_015659 [Anisodus tanguticus]|uniref:Uncharacterized protein n=1 Tax=Anisodus tanguticus TaxID=243964 RepID=A0AAE1VHW5_9SOLA|nr:hypothetical protein RND71_015659 [Anisodus tanguticus]
MLYVEIVKELLSTPSCDITCRVRSGTDERVALHYAAINGSVDIIDELVTVSSDSLKEVTYFGETALHLAVKYFKLEALKRLLIWLEHVGMIEMVNKGDKEGTLLHYAVSRKQLEASIFLLYYHVLFLFSGFPSGVRYQHWSPTNPFGGSALGIPYLGLKLDTLVKEGAAPSFASIG